MKKSTMLLILSVMGSGTLCAGAQEGSPLSLQNVSPLSAPKQPDHFYKLNLVVQETNDAGKVTNERTFVTLVETAKDFMQSIRSDDRVPVAATSDSSQYNRVDVGIDFDIRDVKEIDSALSFRLGLNANSVADIESAEGGTATTPTYNHSVMRQNRWDAGVLIPIGKPTIASEQTMTTSAARARAMIRRILRARSRGDSAPSSTSRTPAPTIRSRSDAGESPMHSSVTCSPSAARPADRCAI